MLSAERIRLWTGKPASPSKALLHQGKRIALGIGLTGYPGVMGLRFEIASRVQPT